MEGKIYTLNEMPCFILLHLLAPFFRARDKMTLVVFYVRFCQFAQSLVFLAADVGFQHILLSRHFMA